MHTFEPSGQIMLGVRPCLSWDRGGLLLTSRVEGLVEMEGGQCADKGVVVSVISSLVASEAWDAQTVEDFENSNDTDGIEDIERKPATCLSSADIVLWCDEVVKSKIVPPSLMLSPFERSVIGGQSVNDILMIKGLIYPPVYIQFLDLCSFSYP